MVQWSTEMKDSQTETHLGVKEHYIDMWNRFKGYRYPRSLQRENHILIILLNYVYLIYPLFSYSFCSFDKSFGY